MLDKTYDLRKKISEAYTIEDKIEVLHRQFQGETAYVVSCGPSLSSLDHDILRSKLQDKLVISVKQAYDILKDQTDFHVFNYIHFNNEYNYGKNRPIVLELNNTRKIVSKQSDIRFPIDFPVAVSPRRYELSVSATGRWNDFLMSKTPVRPMGAGIFYEMCGYLCVHLGVKKLVSIGFDSANPNTHFYGNNTDDLTQERMRILQREMNFVVAGMDGFNKWLRSKGIEWNIISDINPGPKSIKRITIEDIV